MDRKKHSITTRAWAKLCHGCGICAFAARRPDSTFNKIMVWHRTWCPGWKSHTLVYGLKQLPAPKAAPKALAERKKQGGAA